MTDQELVKRPFDEEFDTMMEVQRNPTGAWMAIQEQANRIEELGNSLAWYQMMDAMSSDHVVELTEKLEAAEAKLTKAMEALRETTQMLSQCTFTIIRMGGRYFERHEVVDKARAVLAELEAKE